MKQPAAEKVDPLTRIQEEIKEVVRREQEHRQHASTTNDEQNVIDNAMAANNSNVNANDDNDGLLINSSVPVITDAPLIATLVLHDDITSNTPSLTSSINSRESLDDHHSDDSGISASSSPVNVATTTAISLTNNNDDVKSPITPINKEQRYIGPNCYNITPEPPQQKLMTRTVSTPHLASSKPRQFTFNPAHKGVMQRFIASRGKLQLNNNNNASNKIMLNSKSASVLLNNNSSGGVTPPTTPINANLLVDFMEHNSSIVMPTVSFSPAIIERDAEGKPIRPGYVPVELKIQRELKDLKSRETELKKIRKIRLSTPDLLDSIDNENVETDEEDSEGEHCYGPNQLRSAKSISELCDMNQSNSSISPRTTPSPDFDPKMAYARNNSMRPAMSLAQLCDLTPEEAPSSHRLIAQWESLIQQNA